MISKIRGYFAAAKHIERLPEDEVKRLYPRFRWRVMESTFLGYAVFYLARNNLYQLARAKETGQPRARAYGVPTAAEQLVFATKFLDACLHETYTRCS